ncbi:hypothetical protein SUGI_0621970 [Cryptomeria japonica]|nr:hypothetical protein SUGI_0621970 [Cryptomeria japonica]
MAACECLLGNAYGTRNIYGPGKDKNFIPGKGRNLSILNSLCKKLMGVGGASKWKTMTLEFQLIYSQSFCRSVGGPVFYRMIWAGRASIAGSTVLQRVYPLSLCDPSNPGFKDLRFIAA